MDYIEIQFWKFAKWLIQRGYGADCESIDMDDFPEMYKKPKDAFASSRCGGCRAKETINWIDKHIDLLKF